MIGSPAATEPFDFGRLGPDYDRLRPADERWLELFEAAWDEGDFRGRRVLDVGCGTGRVAAELARRGARVWGVDPSPEMLAVARQRLDPSIGLRAGRAEALPFRDGWFEGAVLSLAVHLVERERALPELHRILAAGGRAVIVTFRPEHFERTWLARFFPSLGAIDRARFPEPRLLRDELLGSGFGTVWVRELSQTATLTREQALERLRGRFVSTLWLLDDEEYRRGLEQAERELPPETSASLDWAIVVAECAGARA